MNDELIQLDERDDIVAVIATKVSSKIAERFALDKHSEAVIDSTIRRNLRAYARRAINALFPPKDQL